MGIRVAIYDIRYGGGRYGGIGFRLTVRTHKVAWRLARVGVSRCFVVKSGLPALGGVIDVLGHATGPKAHGADSFRGSSVRVATFAVRS